MAKKAKKATSSKARRKAPAKMKPEGQQPQEEQKVDAKAKLHETLRRINARFAGRVPASAVSSGAHEPDQDVKAAGVKNGVYRCEGSDWLMHVRNGIVVLFEKARADLARDSVINIPAPGTPDADKTPERPA